jgi:Cu/Ag efflux protein CusF
MKSSLALVMVAAVAALSAPAYAQHKHTPAAPAPAAKGAAAELADGEIRRIDAANGVVLLRHGEIRSLNMGAMTMSFRLKDPAMASQLKVGDKVRFVAEQQGETLLITRIEKAH